MWQQQLQLRSSSSNSKQHVAILMTGEESWVELS